MTAASAQSTVTLSGNYGAAQQSYDRNALAQKGLVVTDSSVRLTATEVLGGGLRASFFSQFTAGSERGAANSAGVTKEDSAISLVGNFGTVAFSNTRTSDTGASAMVFASWLPRTQWYDSISARATTDVVSYTSPVFNGLTVGVSSAEIALVTTTAVLTSGDGQFTYGSSASSGSSAAATLNSNFKVTTLSANYSQGPLMIAFAQKNTNLTAAFVTAGLKKANTELAATYDLGVAKVGLAYDTASTTTGTVTGKDLVGYSVNVPVGAMDIGVNAAERGTNRFIEYGVNYNLSKRTSVRAQAGKMSGVTSNSATNSTVGNQYRFGVYHTF